MPPIMEIQSDAALPVQTPDLVQRGKKVTAAAVGIAVLIQALTLVLARLGDPSSPIATDGLRVLAFALVGYLAVQGRRWARWLIAAVITLQLLAFFLGFIGRIAEASIGGILLGTAFTIGYAASAFLLIASRAVTRSSQRSGKGGKLGHREGSSVLVGRASNGCNRA